MSVVTFHVNVPDPLAYACRLLRKATSLGSRITVTGELETLRRLDSVLWTFSPLEFVPHCWDSAPESMRLASPVVLASDLAQLPPASAVLHLGGALPPALNQPDAPFDKIIEVVGQGAHQVQQARLRWRAYQALGHTMVHHDLAQAA